MQKKIRDAMKAYRTAMKLDETSVPALTGTCTIPLSIYKNYYKFKVKSISSKVDEYDIKIQIFKS